MAPTYQLDQHTCTTIPTSGLRRTKQAGIYVRNTYTTAASVKRNCVEKSHDQINQPSSTKGAVTASWEQNGCTRGKETSFAPWANSAIRENAHFTGKICKCTDLFALAEKFTSEKRHRGGTVAHLPSIPGIVSKHGENSRIVTSYRLFIFI
eukprot:1185476-Prorocentrum_minimum.AAC.2